MRQADPTLVPLSDIGCLTNLEYLHLFGITQQSDFEFDHMGLARMKNLKTLKIVATRSLTLPGNFSDYFKHIENLELVSLRLPNMPSLAQLVNLKQLTLYDVPINNQDELFGLPNLEILKLAFEDRKSAIAELNFKPQLTEKCKKLRQLTLAHCCFNEETCTAITKFPNLEFLSVPYCKDLFAANVYNFAEMNGLKVLDLSYDADYIRVYAAYNALPFYQQIEARAKTLRTVYMVGYTDFREDARYSVDFVHSRK
jgi:hypothetical protein